MSVRTHRISRASERGFSLIELGIVIAVIAVLASVVIVGRGFINSSRTGKAAEALATIRKAGAVYTANMTSPSTVNEVDPLQRRDLLPKGQNDNAGEWTMAGSGTTAFKVTNIRFGMVGTGNAAAINIATPELTQAEDLFKLVVGDPNFLNGGVVAGVNCPTRSATPTSQNMTVCFKL